MFASLEQHADENLPYRQTERERAVAASALKKSINPGMGGGTIEERGFGGGVPQKIYYTLYSEYQYHRFKNQPQSVCNCMRESINFYPVAVNSR